MEIVNDNGSESNVHGWDRNGRPVCRKAKDILAAKGTLCKKYNFEKTHEVVKVSLEEKKPKDFPVRNNDTAANILFGEGLR